MLQSLLAIWPPGFTSKQLAELQQRYLLPVYMGDLPCHDYAYLLVQRDGAIGLLNTQHNMGVICVDFASGKAAHRQRAGGAELIRKAVGAKLHCDLTVADLTAGLGGDAFVLANSGCRMQLFERSPVAACLLEDGIARAQQAEDAQTALAAERMRLYYGAAMSIAPSVFSETPPDVVYIDPMFPASKKSALVKKEMQAFHTLIGDDADSAELLQLGLDYAKYRVVVKRPKKADYLADRKPALALAGKAIRFDIYTLKKMP